ncbi:MAG: hypothetical protein M3Q58_14205 [Bacteroidota bacterium]|nr:hypothetical protein [Bacteroidota bacterium]
MKVVFFILMLVFSSLFLRAQNSDNIEAQPQQEENTFHERKTVSKINANELPEGIQRVISNGEFKKWDIEEAYKVNFDECNEDGQSSYIIVVKRRFDRFALYYDSLGKLIRQERMEELRRS